MIAGRPTGGGAVVDWLDGLRARSGLTVQPIAIDDCVGWSMDDGVWRHATGGFFSIVGVRCLTDMPHLRGVESPMIAQPEIGVLGLIVRRSGAGFEWLLQGKTEPGSVFGTQVAPSVQATQSNYRRVHGGLPTPLIDWFLTPTPDAVTLVDVPQSEQGHCFLGKYNRNAVIAVADGFTPPDSPNWAWFSAGQVIQALAVDFTVNTDARSVLSCADWRMFSGDGGGAFCRWHGQGGFGEALLDSFQSSSVVGDLIADLEYRRAATRLQIQRASLRELRGWTVASEGIFSAAGTGASPSVQAFSVTAWDREVSTWCQPLMVGAGEVRVVLLCAKAGGALRFFLTFSVEPGFVEGVQFAPSLVGDERCRQVEWVAEALADPESVVRAEVLQSDEGGRFANSIARYQIVEAAAGWGESDVPDGDGRWMTLAQLKAMTGRSGLLTNETRSVLSLLLAWA